MKDTFWKVIVTVVLIVFLTFGAGLFIVQGVKNTAISYEEQVAAAQTSSRIWLKRSRHTTSMNTILLWPLSRRVVAVPMPPCLRLLPRLQPWQRLTRNCNPLTTTGS